MGLTDWFKGRWVQAFHLGADDIAVFVVGPSGSGKSFFVEQVTKSGLIKVGTNLRPRTDDVQAIRCELTDEAKKALGVANKKNIVFVDTPSFHTGINDRTAEEEMENWLKKSKSKSTLVGTIYMHRIEDDPCIKPIQQHLDTFALAFPQDFTHLPHRLRAVLTHHEGVISDDVIRARREKFETQLRTLRPSRRGRLRWVTSSHPDHLRGGDPEAAWKVVLALLKD